ncbi:hypothetical protein KSP40_PGU008960 [Platanthera guangdongensis]|uniref:Uncharacterized protein n=1 Tax=Platanthera guangdongensis TaxID=2320717 RepID=A0ABR2N199_9ASPA
MVKSSHPSRKASKLTNISSAFSMDCTIRSFLVLSTSHIMNYSSFTPLEVDSPCSDDGTFVRPPTSCTLTPYPLPTLAQIFAPSLGSTLDNALDNDNFVLSMQRTDVVAITIEKKNQSINRRVMTEEKEDGDDIDDFEYAAARARSFVRSLTQQDCEPSNKDQAKEPETPVLLHLDRGLINENPHAYTESVVERVSIQAGADRVPVIPTILEHDTDIVVTVSGCFLRRRPRRSAVLETNVSAPKGFTPKPRAGRRTQKKDRGPQQLQSGSSQSMKRRTKVLEGSEKCVHDVDGIEQIVKLSKDEDERDEAKVVNESESSAIIENHTGAPTFALYLALYTKSATPNQAYHFFDRLIWSILT